MTNSDVALANAIKDLTVEVRRLGAKVSNNTTAMYKIDETLVDLHRSLKKTSFYDVTINAQEPIVVPDKEE